MIGLLKNKIPNGMSFELSDRITVFRNGKYIDTVNTKDVQEKDIISMMIGHELNIEKKSGSRAGTFSGKTGKGNQQGIRDSGAGGRSVW